MIADDDGLVLIGGELLDQAEVTRRAVEAMRPHANNIETRHRRSLLRRYHDNYRDPVSGVFDPLAPSFREFVACGSSAAWAAGV